MRSRAERLQNQNEQVVTFTLVEFLTALVFVAMALALILKNEALRDLNPTQEQVRQLRDTLKARDQRISELERETGFLSEELDAQRSLVRRLMAQAGVPLPPNDIVVIPKGDYDRTRNAVEVTEEQQRELARLQEQIARLTGGGNVVRPACTTNSGYLLTISLSGDGSFRSAPAWSSVASENVARIDGLSDLATGGSMGQAAFARLATRVDDWGRDQSPPCAFRVTVESNHSNLSLYLRQLAAVERSFYVRRAR